MIQPESEEELSMSDGSDTFSGSADEVSKPPAVWEKNLCLASTNVNTSIRRIAAHEAIMEIEVISRRHKSSNTLLASSRQKLLPGSVEQKKKKQVELQEQTASTDPKSYQFQTKEMSSGSLLPAWKRPGYDMKKVSLHL